MTQGTSNFVAGLTGDEARVDRDSEEVSTQAVLFKLGQIFSHKFNNLEGAFHSLEVYVETVDNKLDDKKLVVRSQAMEGALRLHHNHDNVSVTSLVASAQAIEKYLVDDSDSISS